MRTSLAFMGIFFLAFTSIACGSSGGTGTGGKGVHVWLTTQDLANRLTPKSDAVFDSSATATVTFDETIRMQNIDGFGAAFTDTSAYLLNALDAGSREQVLADLFSRATGIGLSLMRAPMGASDFTSCSCTYSYDDGAADPALGRFSTAHDDAYIIPVIKQAQAVNPEMKLFANPWSPPAWMKTNDSQLGTSNGVVGALREDAVEPLARYFVRFIQEYRSKGVALWGITPQNEPTFAPATYPGMSFPANQELAFIANHLAPALAAAGLGDIHVFGGDDIGANLAYADTLFSDATVANFLYGTAWHCYNGVEDMYPIHDQRPDKPLYLTECSTGPTGIAGNTAEETLLSTNHWASGVVLWNLALDETGGPKLGQGCNGCTGLVTIDPATKQYSYTINFYELGHFSKFLAPGAQRIAHRDGGGIWAQAYRNPDGSIVLVIHNTNTTTTSFTVGWTDKGNLDYALPAEATVTFTDSDAGFAAARRK